MTETLPKVFENHEFGQVRVVTGQDNEPWFVAADVCAALKHSNSRMALSGLDDDERGVSKVYTPGGEQEMNIISLVKPDKNDKVRKAMYAKVAIARKQLPEMDNDDVFRDFLADKFQGKRSQRDLTSVELIRLVDVLARCGAVYTDKTGNKRRERPYVRSDFIEIPEDDPNSSVKRMICAIWRKLGYSMTSLETRIERQTGLLTILGLHDRKKLSSILTDLRKREKSAFGREKQAAAGEIRA
jgi:hypothetical protein